MVPAGRRPPGRSRDGPLRCPSDPRPVDPPPQHPHHTRNECQALCAIVLTVIFGSRCKVSLACSKKLVSATAQARGGADSGTARTAQATARREGGRESRKEWREGRRGGGAHGVVVQQHGEAQQHPRQVGSLEVEKSKEIHSHIWISSAPYINQHNCEGLAKEY